MERFLEQHSEVLVDGLRYEAGSKASSIQERRELTVHPSGSSSYNPTGGRTTKFVIADMNGYAALNTIRLQCQVAAGAAEFCPLGSLHNSLISSTRIVVAGTVVESLAFYNRCYSLFEKCLPRSTHVMNSSEGSGLLKPYGSTVAHGANDDAISTALWEDKQQVSIPA